MGEWSGVMLLVEVENLRLYNMHRIAHKPTSNHAYAIKYIGISIYTTSVGLASLAQLYQERTMSVLSMK